MTRAICVCFHLYQNYGKSFYEPILNFFLQNMKKYKDEYDQLYLVDSNWGIPESPDYTVLKVNPSLRYYEAYKEVLPQIKEDLVLLMDNDFIIYRKGLIDETFKKLEEYDVISIIDTIGTMKVPLKKGNKCCPYFFAIRKDLLMNYLNVDWGPDAMPYTETFGLLTEAILKDGHTIYEIEEDKSDIYFDEHTSKKVGKNLGYYHIRAGSVPAVLLAYKYNDSDKYWEYLKTQPQREYLRQVAWYHYMELSTSQESTKTWGIIRDLKIDQADWTNYMNKFKEFHGLE